MADQLLSRLRCISPADGRYGHITAPLADYFSEEALIKYRLHVEVEYLISLAHHLSLFELPDESAKRLRMLVSGFNTQQAQAIKDIEKTTNHDVKAVEYFLKAILEQENLDGIKEFVHFSLTSQDINNTAIPYSIKAAMQDCYLPVLRQVLELLENFAEKWKNVPMMAFTHGQPASPTRMGKELMVFVSRLKGQLLSLEAIPYSAKFGGATGNFNAHHAAYPDIDWVAFADHFVESSMGLKRSPITTQIEPYDDLAALCDALRRINVILIDLCRDCWTYISMNYFVQKTVEGEIGSSAMPHKVNPIDFENAEGNLGLANAVLGHLAEKLPISRLQRDLTDSTVLRNIGLPFAHGLIAFQSLLKGLNKIKLNEEKLNADLELNWAVVAEGIQTILRRESYPNPYEALKALTRGKEKVSKADIQAFIMSLDISDSVRQELLALSPSNYTGISLF